MRSAPVCLSLAASAVFAGLGLTGCGTTSTAILPSPAEPLVQGSSIAGTVHGGQQPISGAHVYLFAAGTGGYNGAAASLLSATKTGFSDSVGAYVPTDGNGNFNISGDYTCTANTQVYLYALGGNPGSGTNSAAGLLAVLGNCPSTGNLATQTPVVLVNEISTVAAAYAFAGFAVDATHVSSSGSALAKTGIASAFANAAQMDNIADSKSARAKTPSGNGTVPQALIHSLANILAACINSTGPASTSCTTLLGNAKNTSGGIPTDTATAAINIAHSPAANVAALFALDNATAPFQPHLSLQPNDFSITLSYSGGFSSPAGIAIDSSGNAWVANYTGNTLTRTTPLGVTTAQYTSTTNLPAPYGVVIAPTTSLNGLVWVTTTSSPYLVQYVPGGAATPASSTLPVGATDMSLPGFSLTNDLFAGAVSGSTSYLFFEPGGVASYPAATLDASSLVTNPRAYASDGNNFSWIPSFGGSSGSATLLKYRFDGPYTNVAPVTCTGPNYASASGIAMDRAFNAWISDASTGYLVEFTNNCVYSTSYSVAGLAGGGLVGLAMDGNNNVWTLTGSNRVVGITNAGVPLSGNAGYVTGASGTQLGPVIDGSGNLWFTNASSNTVGEMIGVATPVVTPIADGLVSPATRP